MRQGRFRTDNSSSRMSESATGERSFLASRTGLLVGASGRRVRNPRPITVGRKQDFHDFRRISRLAVSPRQARRKLVAQFRQRVGQQHVGGRRVCSQAGHEHARQRGPVTAKLCNLAIDFTVRALCQK
jgi:hypothetical protein